MNSKNVVLRSVAMLMVIALMLSLFGCRKSSRDDDFSSGTWEYWYEDETVTTSGDKTGTGSSEAGSGSAGNGQQSNNTGNGNNSSESSKTTVEYGAKGDTLSKVPKNLSGEKLKMLLWWQPGDSDKKLAAEFKEKTGITVTYEYASLKDYQTRLASMTMANNAPALAAIINEWYPQPITRGLMQPISNTGWDFTDSVYATNLMDKFSYKGKYYGIALKKSTMTTFIVMFYNKRILKEKGIKTTPTDLWKSGKWNWNTCLDIAQKTTDASKKQYGMSLTYQNYWMLSAGQDFVFTDKNGMSNNIKSSKLLESWNFAWDVINTYKVVDTSFTGSTPFYNGTAAMLAGGSFLMQSGNENYVPAQMKDDWGVVPFPSPEGQKSVAACEGIVWGFPEGKSNKDKKLQAAAWYLRYYLDDSNNLDASFYPKQECWDVINWMWDQDICSFNSIGVLTYGGEYTAASIQYNLIDSADSKAKLKSNLDSWYSVFNANIKSIENEMG